jgi:hypothetical protein
MLLIESGQWSDLPIDGIASLFVSPHFLNSVRRPPTPYHITSLCALYFRFCDVSDAKMALGHSVSRGPWKRQNFIPQAIAAGSRQGVEFYGRFQVFLIAHVMAIMTDGDIFYHMKSSGYHLPSIEFHSDPERSIHPSCTHPTAPLEKSKRIKCAMTSMVNQITLTIPNSSMLISDRLTHVITIIRSVRCPRKDHLHC